MSRGFVKEGDQEEIPLLSPRAFLPNGVENYVTLNGLAELKAEKEDFETRIANLRKESQDKNRVKINYLTAQMGLLDERINSARPIEPKETDINDGVVRFGAIVSLQTETKTEANASAQTSAQTKTSNANSFCCEYQIVGVDEAAPEKNKISFISPFARALVNRKVGESVCLKTPGGERKMTIKSVTYPQK